ncbi:jg21015, partial [Pararge aegeria aegeria]
GNWRDITRRWTLRSQRDWNGDPASVNAASVCPQRDGRTTSDDELLETARNKRPKIVDFQTPYKRPMSSSESTRTSPSVIDSAPDIAPRARKLPATSAAVALRGVCCDASAASFLTFVEFACSAPRYSINHRN